MCFDAEPQSSGSFCRSDDDKASDSGTEVGSDFSGGMFPESGDDEEYFSEEETRSRFTNYSMTSSVIRRNDQLSHLDDRFEKVREHSLIELSGLAFMNLRSAREQGIHFSSSRNVGHDPNKGHERPKMGRAEAIQTWVKRVDC